MTMDRYEQLQPHWTGLDLCRNSATKDKLYFWYWQTIVHFNCNRDHELCKNTKRITGVAPSLTRQSMREQPQSVNTKLLSKSDQSLQGDATWSTSQLATTRPIFRLSSIKWANCVIKWKIA